jgi:hypothetical protein
MTNNFFSPLSFVAVFGSGIRDKHPGSATLNYRPLYQKLSISSQKYGFGIRDLGSGKNLFRIPDPGGQKGTGSRKRNTASKYAK